MGKRGWATEDGCCWVMVEDLMLTSLQGLSCDLSMPRLTMHGHFLLGSPFCDLAALIR